MSLRDNIFKELVSHMADLSGKSTRTIKKEMVPDLVQKALGAMSDEKLSLTNFVTKGEHERAVRSASYLKNVGGYADPETSKIAVLEPLRASTIFPHELRHIEQFADKDYTKMVYPAYTDKVAARADKAMGYKFGEFYNSLAPKYDIGSLGDWQRAYDPTGTFRVNESEVDAMLSELGTLTKAGVSLHNWNPIVRPSRAAMWDYVSQGVKKHYIETAGFAGAGLASTIARREYPGLGVEQST